MKGWEQGQEGEGPNPGICLQSQVDISRGRTGTRGKSPRSKLRRFVLEKQFTKIEYIFVYRKVKVNRSNFPREQNIAVKIKTGSAEHENTINSRHIITPPPHTDSHTHTENHKQAPDSYSTALHMGSLRYSKQATNS